MNSGGGECHHNTGDGDAMLRLVLDALVKCVSKAGGPLPTVGRVFFPQITEQSECRGDTIRTCDLYVPKEEFLKSISSQTCWILRPIRSCGKFHTFPDIEQDSRKKSENRGAMTQIVPRPR